MKKLTIVLAALLLAACDQTPCECVCYPEQKKRLGERLNVMRGLEATAVTPKEAGEVIVCRPGEPCRAQVRIVEKDGKCQAQLPYCVICVVKGKNYQTTSPIVVVWEITDGAGKPTTAYEFDRRKGIDLFFGGSTGKHDFHSEGIADNSPQLFKWVAGTDRSDRLAHAAGVKRVGSEERCAPVDPDLVNTN